MGPTRHYYLADTKHRRAFWLGTVHGDVVRCNETVVPLALIRKRVRAVVQHWPGAYRHLADQIWAFCQVASWQVEMRCNEQWYSDEELLNGRYTLVGSTDPTMISDDDRDPCRTEQLRWETDATLLHQETP